VAATISRLDATATAPLSAYWLSLVGDRNAYAETLQALLGDRGMAVLIVRQDGFDNPNALMVDLVHLLEHNRERFLAAIARPRPDPDRIGLVLLARIELAMGQGTSPVTWPEWVPAVGTRETSCFITDVTRRVEAPLDAEEVDVGRLQRALHAVERALLRRLLAVHEHTPTAHNALLQNISRRSDVSWLEFLAGARHEVQKIAAVDSYRPSVRYGKSVVSRLWGHSLKGTSQDVTTIATALAAALDMAPDEPLDTWWEGLPTVLARHPGPALPPPERFCRHVVVTLATACQYATCAAHSDDYAQYPVNLLVSVIDDLHRALVDIEMCLNRFSDGRNRLAPAAPRNEQP
jgi:hypothetical protein